MLPVWPKQKYYLTNELSLFNFIYEIMRNCDSTFSISIQIFSVISVTFLREILQISFLDVLLVLMEKFQQFRHKKIHKKIVESKK